MIAAVVLGLALMSSEYGSGHSQLLEAKAACRLIKGSKFPSGIMYSVPGTYNRGTHWSSFEVPGCNESALGTVVFGSEAARKISAWHRAYREKCGGQFMGDDFASVFTGTFVRRKVTPPLIGGPGVMTNVLVISDFDSGGLGSASITCPNKRPSAHHPVLPLGTTACWMWRRTSGRGRWANSKERLLAGLAREIEAPDVGGQLTGCEAG